METTGRMIDVTTDFKTRKRRVTFEVDNVSDDELNRLYGLEKLDITADAHKVKRSLSANAYFHVIAGKIAEALTISKAAAKNKMITSYGQRMYVGDSLACIKTNLEIEQVQEMEEPHLKFIRVSDDGANMFVIYRGSHTYNSKEMSYLIDGTVAEAKDLGIETMPPERLKRLLEAWKPKEV